MRVKKHFTSCTHSLLEICDVTEGRENPLQSEDRRNLSDVVDIWQREAALSVSDGQKNQYKNGQLNHKLVQKDPI